MAHRPALACCAMLTEQLAAPLNRLAPSRRSPHPLPMNRLYESTNAECPQKGHNMHSWLSSVLLNVALCRPVIHQIKIVYMYFCQWIKGQNCRLEGNARQSIVCSPSSEKWRMWVLPRHRSIRQDWLEKEKGSCDKTLASSILSDSAERRRWEIDIRFYNKIYI